MTRYLLGLPASNTSYSTAGANVSSPVPEADPRESEDCLFLDVFVPEDVLSKAGQGYGAPVLVWIYGGGYTGGQKNYNPAGLLAASGNSSNGDVIYVAMNYRLGATGWMGGPSYQAEGGVSNLGLYDQRFALEWVQENIHLFGGDKNRVSRNWYLNLRHVLISFSRLLSLAKVLEVDRLCIRLLHMVALTVQLLSNKLFPRAPDGNRQLLLLRRRMSTRGSLRSPTPRLLRSCVLFHLKRSCVRMPSRSSMILRMAHIPTGLWWMVSSLLSSQPNSWLKVDSTRTYV